MSARSKQTGLSLIGLMTGIAVLGVVTAAGMPTYKTFLEASQTDTDVQNIIEAHRLARSEARKGVTANLETCESYGAEFTDYSHCVFKTYVNFCVSTNGKSCTTGDKWSDGFAIIKRDIVYKAVYATGPDRGTPVALKNSTYTESFWGVNTVKTYRSRLDFGSEKKSATIVRLFGPLKGTLKAHGAGKEIRFDNRANIVRSPRVTAALAKSGTNHFPLTYCNGSRGVMIYIRVNAPPDAQTMTKTQYQTYCAS